jgi:hypothetical protein
VIEIDRRTKGIGKQGIEDKGQGRMWARDTYVRNE